MMGMTETQYIAPSGSLDGITIYWHNYEVGKGMVTVVCYASAWNCYFGGMGGKTIQEFFDFADVGYLTNKLGCTQWLKQTKAHENYLKRIIQAIKVSRKPELQETL